MGAGRGPVIGPGGNGVSGWERTETGPGAHCRGKVVFKSFILKGKALEAKQSSRKHSEELSPSLDFQSPGSFPRGNHTSVSFQRGPMPWQADIAFVCMFPLIVKSAYRKVENMVKDHNTT